MSFADLYLFSGRALPSKSYTYVFNNDRMTYFIDALTNYYKKSSRNSTTHGNFVIPDN